MKILRGAQKRRKYLKSRPEMHAADRAARARASPAHHVRAQRTETISSLWEPPAVSYRSVPQSRRATGIAALDYATDCTNAGPAVMNHSGFLLIPAPDVVPQV